MDKDRPLTDLQERCLLVLHDVTHDFGGWVTAEQVKRGNPTFGRMGERGTAVAVVGRGLSALAEKGLARRSWLSEWAMWQYEITDKGRAMLDSMGD